MSPSPPLLAFVWSGELPAKAIEEMFSRPAVSRRAPRTPVAAFVAARGPQPAPIRGAGR